MTARKPSVFTVDPFGVVSGLHSDSFSLAQLGPVKITQVSTVDFNDVSQRWEVTFVQGALTGRKLTDSVQLVARGEASLDMATAVQGRVVDFPSYTAAVNAEIETIEGLKLKGLQWVS